ncbi:conserved hypothetical protein [Ricinus communis]|uniref:Uncharacterized protein n=1 Tax=Ricinus communis TaxID=3988 RepID=B9SZ43_RICCO|nr:conserved hypothetical protein [Ricinus communis]
MEKGEPGIDTLSNELAAMNIQQLVKDSKKAKNRLKDFKKDKNFENLKALFHQPVVGNILTLHDHVTDLPTKNMERNKNLQGKEARMYALLNKGEDKDFKNDEGESKKSFLEWLRECDESDDDDWETLKDLKIKAVNLGINLSRLALDLKFLTTVDGDLYTKGLVLASALNWVFDEDENSVVVQTIYELLTTENVEIMAPETKESKQAMIAEKWAKSIDESLIEDATDKPILLFLSEVFRFECFWMHRGLPSSKKSLKYAIPSLVAEFHECEEAFKVVENEVKDLIKQYSDMYEQDLNMKKKSDEYKALESEIKEFWSRI